MSIPKIATYPMPQAAALPSNRVAWQLDPKRAVLLIHDMQSYFVDFFDASAAPVPTLIDHIACLRQACDAVQVPVVYTAQPGEQSAAQRGLLQDWWGPGITAQPDRVPVVQPLAPREQDVVLTKWRYSAFVRSDLRERMQAQGRDQLIVCGVYAHIGCMLTTADAFMSDIQPFFVGDAVADFSAEQHAMAVNYVSQRCGMVLGTEQIIQALAPRQAKGSLPLSLEALREEVATLLEMPASDLRLDDNLLDMGLDSIRLMSLVERWRALDARITFIALAEQATLQAWWPLLSAPRGGA